MALSPCKLGHTYGVKVLRIDRPDGRRVLKFDGLSGRGLWWRLRRMFYNAACSGESREPFPSSAARLACFSTGESPVVRFYHKRAPSINLEASTTTLSGKAAVKLKNPRGDSPVKL